MNKSGNRLAALREHYGFTQEEVANRLKISRAALSHYETNRREPDYETLLKFADYYHVSVDYLLGRTGQDGKDPLPPVDTFMDSLELSDENLLNRFSLTIDGRRLSSQEAKRFIAFIRADRDMHS